MVAAIVSLAALPRWDHGLARRERDAAAEIDMPMATVIFWTALALSVDVYVG
jgi:hypothetical protein